MSVYLVVWLVLCLLTLKQSVGKETRTAEKIEFWFCFLILAGMLVFRYGQGSDGSVPNSV